MGIFTPLKKDRVVSFNSCNYRGRIDCTISDFPKNLIFVTIYYVIIVWNDHNYHFSMGQHFQQFLLQTALASLQWGVCIALMSLKLFKLVTLPTYTERFCPLINRSPSFPEASANRIRIQIVAIWLHNYHT